MEQMSFFTNPEPVSKEAKKAYQEFQEITADLEFDFNRHQELLDKGGNDPFWPDGMNLFLKRNHIIFNKSELERLHDQFGFRLPPVYHKETPEPVDMEYMAPGSKSGKLRRH